MAIIELLRNILVWNPKLWLSRVSIPTIHVPRPLVFHHALRPPFSSRRAPLEDKYNDQFMTRCRYTIIAVTWWWVLIEKCLVKSCIYWQRLVHHIRSYTNIFSSNKLIIICSKDNRYDLSDHTILIQLIMAIRVKNLRVNTTIYVL